MMSRSTSIAHGSPSTSTAALIGHPERPPAQAASYETALRDKTSSEALES
jgi:hypothetical protein